MTGQAAGTVRRGVAQGMAALSFLLLLAVVVLLVRYGLPAPEDLPSVEFAAIGVAAAIAYPILALLIIGRHPRHTVGWLLLLTGFSAALGSLAYSLEVLPGDVLARPFFTLILWSASWTWIMLLFVPVSLVLLFFPDGRLPSPRWWPVLVALLIGLGGTIVADAFGPFSYTVGAEQTREISNPFGIAAVGTYDSQLWAASGFFQLIGTVGALVGMAVRFRRSHGMERNQMKWLLYTVGLAMSVLVLLSLFLDEDNPILAAIMLPLPVVLAIVMGIAILRHRLFDIDIIIRRTLQYSIVSAVLALTYFGSVVLLQRLTGLAGAEQSPLTIVLSTLLIAALFNPLRQRVQSFIDRRFYRQQYDAQQVLARFATAARDETDLDSLTAELAQVIEDTMQPHTVSLWLRETTPTTKGAEGA